MRVRPRQAAPLGRAAPARRRAGAAAAAHRTHRPDGPLRDAAGRVGRGGKLPATVDLGREHRSRR